MRSCEMYFISIWPRLEKRDLFDMKKVATHKYTRFYCSGICASESKFISRRIWRRRKEEGKACEISNAGFSFLCQIRVCLELFSFSGDVVGVSGYRMRGKKRWIWRKKSICGKEKKIISLLLFLLLCFENSKLENDDLSEKSKFECKTESSIHFGESLPVPIFPFPLFQSNMTLYRASSSRKKTGEDEEKEEEEKSGSWKLADRLLFNWAKHVVGNGIRYHRVSPSN